MLRSIPFYFIPFYSILIIQQTISNVWMKVSDFYWSYYSLLDFNRIQTVILLFVVRQASDRVIIVLNEVW